MEKVVRSSKSVTYTILDGIVSTAVLIISVATSKSTVDEELSPYMFMILFFALTGMRVVQAALNKDKGKKGVLRLLIGAGIYGIISLILLIWGINDTVTLVIMVIYLLDVIAGRVFAIIQGKRLIGRIFNGIICALIIDLSISTLTMEEGQENSNSILLVLLVVIVVRSLLHIIALSFSQIKLDVLMKIIRRTYALEILFGLLMMIATFSYVFTFLEDSIIDYWDGLWYCFAIVTTIGFGDIAATTITGRVLSVILGIYGIIVVSMVTSIIINFYGEMKDMQEKERRKELEQQAKKKKKAKAVIEKSEEETEEESEEESEEETEEESEENEVEDSDEDTEEESGGEGED